MTRYLTDVQRRLELHEASTGIVINILCLMMRCNWLFRLMKRNRGVNWCSVIAILYASIFEKVIY